MKALKIVAAVLVASMTAVGAVGEEAVASEIQAKPALVWLPGIGNIPYQRIFETVSEPGESLDDFMLRISPALHAYTLETGFEACGLIAKGGDGRHGVVMGSNHAQLSCVLVKVVPAGMTVTHMSIHSHPPDDLVVLNSIDRQIMGFSPVRTTYRTDADSFSAMDKAGYLLSTQTGLLLSQARVGGRNVRRIGRISTR
ncbi:MAG: hypothetical protein ACREXR_05800 [Gammaproteobacteria bacterium]